MNRTELSPAETLAALAVFGGARVVVVGDVIVDAYLSGRVERRSPEAPVPVVDVEEEWSALGGAANVAHQLAVLGAEVALFGVVGDDDPAERLLAHCADAGLDPSGIVVAPGRTTTRKVRVIADRQQVVRLDWERRDDIASEIESRLLEALRSGAAPDVVVISDYGKGVLTDRVLRAVVDAGRRWGVPVLVDPTRRGLSAYRGASLIKMNRVECEAVLGRTLAGPGPDEATADLAASGPAMLLDGGVDTLVVTLGEHGMVVVDAAGARLHPTRPTDVYDVGGAGDTVIALLALAAARGLDIDNAAPLANMAASAAVRKVGVSVVGAAEILDRATSNAAQLVVSRPELAELVGAWKRHGRRVVFTNGCFDLLHEGHLELLAAAAEEGEALVVAVNSDESVRQLKGPGRPILGQDERCSILASVTGVDAVVVFDGHDLLDLLAEVAPDVLVKGADYSLDEVVGRDLVEQSGGKVVLVPLLAGHSTSELVRRLREPGTGDGRPT